MLTNDFYNNNLKNYARKHRNNSTKAEIKLWANLLRGSKLHGYPFKRQRPIDIYIADFVCLPIQLIIEVDGISHTWENAPKYDIERTKRLNSLGYSVIRFNDDEILNHIDKVYYHITEWMFQNGHLPKD